MIYYLSQLQVVHLQSPLKAYHAAAVAGWSKVAFLHAVLHPQESLGSFYDDLRAARRQDWRLQGLWDPRLRSHTVSAFFWLKQVTKLVKIQREGQQMALLMGETAKSHCALASRSEKLLGLCVQMTYHKYSVYEVSFFVFKIIYFKITSYLH